MTDSVPRLRVIAGPNGSGKSTLKSLLRPEWLGPYINPDDIEASIRERGVFAFDTFGVSVPANEIRLRLLASTLLQIAGLSPEVSQLRVSENEIGFAEVSVNSYWASVIADIARNKLLENKRSLTFETVMSSPDKVAFMKLAQESGFRTYLYFIATQNPVINMARIRHRVQMGGHDVPTDKIVSRYHRSIELLGAAIKASHRSFLFDNSGREAVLIAEITNGTDYKLMTDRRPQWFRELYEQQIP